MDNDLACSVNPTQVKLSCVTFWIMLQVSNVSSSQICSV